MIRLGPSSTRYERERVHLSHAHANLVKKKIEDGTYPLEKTKCFCGSDNDIEIMTKERNEIPHRIVMCQACALLRADPRMTQEAYSDYYNEHYRLINFAWNDKKRQLHSLKQEKRWLWDNQVNNGEIIFQQWLELSITSTRWFLGFRQLT